MEFLAAMKTIRRMHEQCACGAGQQIETGKPLCPLYTTAFPCTDIFLYTDDSIIEKIIQKWDAENPEPQYPTWGEWFAEQGELSADWKDLRVVSCSSKSSAGIIGLFYNKIPADIAQKLGVRPKEG